MESKSSSEKQEEAKKGYSISLVVDRIKEGIAKAEEEQEEAKREDSIRCKASIYKIDTERDREAYTPQMVSLGPYHHGRSHLQSMEIHKWRALYRALDRHNHQVQVYINAIIEVEERARMCYQGPISQSSDDFIVMMVIDACFVLEFLRCSVYHKDLDYIENDVNFFMSRRSIWRDMMLVENQVPLFILDKLLSIQEAPDDITGLTLRFFQPMMCINDRDKKNQPHEGLHCLEVLWRSVMVFQAVEPEATDGPWIIKWWWNRSHSLSDQDHGGLKAVQQKPIPCAIQLRDAGIKFKIHNTSVLSDIAFKNGILKLPPLLIDDCTESFFSNFIAYEKCADNKMYYANSYILFMSDLIKSPDDAMYLSQQRIILNQLRSDGEVVEMFKRLGRRADVGPNGGSLHKVSSDVNDYCHDKWNRIPFY